MPPTISLRGRRYPDGELHRMPPMPRPIRQAFLTLHIATSVGWIGVDLVLLTLAVTGLNASDPGLIRAVYEVAALVAWAVVLPLSLLTLVLGVLLGIGTPWGLLKHWWVAAKLVIGLLMVALALFVLVPRLDEASDRVKSVPAAAVTADTVGAVKVQLVIAPCVSMVLLLTALVLSQYKPWGRTAYGERRRVEARAAKADARERATAASRA